MDTVTASHSFASRKQLALGFAIAAATLASGTTAVAQIELYAARVTQHYSQTSDAAPVADYYHFDAQLRTVNVGDAGWVTLAGSTLNGGDLQNLSVTGRTWSINSQGYGTLAALKTDYPIPQTYFLEAGGGIFVEPQQVNVRLEDNFPDAVPFLTGSTFSGLNNWNPSLGNFQMTFNSHSDFGLSDPNYVKTYVTFYDKTTNDGNPINWYLDNSDTALLLDGSLFTAGHEYTGYLQFFHQYSDTDHVNFGSINGLTTSFDFTTVTGQGPGEIPAGAVPEPSTYGLMGATALSVLILYRRRKKTAA
jgi:hypothetical protein